MLISNCIVALPGYYTQGWRCTSAIIAYGKPWLVYIHTETEVSSVLGDVVDEGGYVAVSAPTPRPYTPPTPQLYLFELDVQRLLSPDTGLVLMLLWLTASYTVVPSITGQLTLRP